MDSRPPVKFDQPTYIRGGIMWRFLSVTSWILFLGFASPASAQFSDACKQIQTRPFTCQVGACQQTIQAKTCQNLTIAPKRCLGCLQSEPCCGQQVCRATFDELSNCSDDEPFGLDVQLLEKAREAPLSLVARMYVPTCDGDFISLRALLKSAPGAVHTASAVSAGTEPEK